MHELMYSKFQDMAKNSTLQSYVEQNKDNLSNTYVYIYDSYIEIKRPLLFQIILYMANGHITPYAAILQCFNLLEELPECHSNREKRIYNAFSYCISCGDSKEVADTFSALLFTGVDPNRIYCKIDGENLPLLFAVIKAVCFEKIIQSYAKPFFEQLFLKRNSTSTNIKNIDIKNVIVNIDGNNLNALHYAAVLYKNHDTDIEICKYVIDKLIKNGMDSFKETLYNKKFLDVFDITREYCGLELTKRSLRPLDFNLLDKNNKRIDERAVQYSGFKSMKIYENYKSIKSI